MNIVIVDHYAGAPSLGMEFRPFYFARGWERMGHRVKIIGGSFSHVRHHQPDVNTSVKEEVVDGIGFLWLKTNYYEGNGLGRIWSMLVFTWRLYANAAKHLALFKPDLVIASSTYPLENFSIFRLARKFRCQYCFEVHDLWPLSPMELGGYSRYNPFIMVMQWAEDFAYKRADFIISLLPNAKPHMVSRGMKPEKFSFVPNGFVREEWEGDVPAPEEHQNIIAGIKQKFAFLIAYAGSHGIANSLDSLVRAGAHVNNAIAILLIGDGPDKPQLVELAKKLNAKNVYFLPPVGKKSVPAILKNFDALFIGLQKQSLFRFGISPNKMIDYMMSGKPVVQAIEAGNNMVEEYACGVSVEPENETAIAAGINCIFEMPVEKRILLGANGRSAALKFHDYDRLCARFLEAAKNAQSQQELATLN